MGICMSCHDDVCHYHDHGCHNSHRKYCHTNRSRCDAYGYDNCPTTTCQNYPEQQNYINANTQCSGYTATTTTKRVIIPPNNPYYPAVINPRDGQYGHTPYLPSRTQQYTI